MRQKDDLISRQDAIDALIPIVKSASLRNRNVYSMARKCLGAIEDVPSVERKGKWVNDIAYYDEDGYPCIVTRCNMCGAVSPISNFCPNCGCKMER